MKYFIICTFLLFGSLVYGQKELNLFFELNESSLTTDHRKQLQAFIEKNNFKEIDSIVVKGFCDKSGDSNYNLKLSKKRVTAVTNQLTKTLSVNEQIKTRYYGSSLAKQAVNDKDRKVNIIVYLKGSDKISDLYGQLLQKQVFIINPQKDTIIKGLKGGYIEIKAGTFNTLENEGKVNFEIIEAYTKSDMVLANLSTTSNGSILETGGMIYLNAYNDTDTLQPQKPINISIPTKDDILQGATMFSGERDPQTDAINWSIGNNSALRSFQIQDFRNCKSLKNLQQDYFKCGGNFGNCCDYDGNSINSLDSCINFCLYNCVLDYCISENQCKFFWCKIKRVVRKIGSLVSRKQKIRIKAQEENKTTNSRLKELAKKENKNLEDLLEMEQIIKKKEGTDTTIYSTEIKQLLKLNELAIRSDSFAQASKNKVDLLSTCNKLDSLYQLYGVDNGEDLTLAMNKDLFDEFNVTTIEALLDTLPKANLGSLEAAIRDKKIEYEDFKFYVFNTTDLGWKNVDIFANIKGPLVAISINQKPIKQADCKLVFVDRQFVLPSKIGTKSFYFDQIPENEKAWLVAIKYEDATPYLSLEQIVIRKNMEYELNYKKRTLEQLKADLRVLDFK